MSDDESPQVAQFRQAAQAESARIQVQDLVMSALAITSSLTAIINQSARPMVDSTTGLRVLAWLEDDKPVVTHEFTPNPVISLNPA